MADSSNTPVKTATQGQYFAAPTAFEVDGHAFAAGRLMRCERGAGKRPGVAAQVAMVSDAGDVVLLDLTTLNGLQAREAAPLPLGITAKIEVFDALSQETVALSGTLTWQDQVFPVRCSGCGDGVAVEAPPARQKALSEALDQYLLDAGLDPEALANPYRESIGHLVNFLVTTAGLETYADTEIRQWGQFQDMLKPQEADDSLSPN